MLLSFLTQQKNQHTQSQILSWNTDAFSSKFLAEKAQAAYKTNHAFFYENILHHKTFTFSKQMTALLMSKSMSQEGQWREYYYFLPKTQQQETEILKNL